MPFSLHDVVRINDVNKDMGIVFDELEDKTRQEFSKECDVNHILAQHGYVMRPVVYGTHDFDSDLTGQMQSRSIFQAWFESAPVEVREAYPDLGSFLAGIGSGAFKTGLEASEGTSEASSPSASPPAAGALG